MVNLSLFKTAAAKVLPATDALNAAGAPAYQLSPEAALAQLAVTGTFRQTYYAGAEAQLNDVLRLAAEVDAEYLGQLAVYAYEQGFMKDMPAMLLALLSTLPHDAFVRAFPRVVRTGKMLRNFVQIVRSGTVGRKSLGSRPKRMIQAWLETASDEELLLASVGNDPSLADVIKMVHPKPKSAAREALFGYLVGKPHEVSLLPAELQALLAFRQHPSGPVPAVPFQLLTALGLTGAQWVEVAMRSSWQMLRQNLNTFQRHGAFEVEGFAEWLASRLSDRASIAKARVMPYQLLATVQNAEGGLPEVVRRALHAAMETALENVPRLDGKVVVCPDVSGSMRSSVTGVLAGATSKVRCVDVAGLVSAALLRVNPAARVLPFDWDVVPLDIDPHAGVLANARQLASVGGGGTSCSAPLRHLVRQRASVDLVVFVSDNESWMDAKGRDGATETMQAWQELKKLNPAAKLVCIDLQPNTTTQAVTRADVLNIGGFSDQVFAALGAFARDDTPDALVHRIKAVRF